MTDRTDGRPQGLRARINVIASRTDDEIETVTADVR